MLSALDVSEIVTVVTTLLVYCVAVTVAGYFRARVALAMGDDTPERMGFLTFDPFAHIDYVGLFILFFTNFRFGWGRYIIINDTYMVGPRAWLKKIAAYFSDTFLHILFSSLGLCSLMIAFGPSLFVLGLPVILFAQITPQAFAHAYPTYSSIAITLGFIGIIWTYFNAMFATLSFIMNGVRWVLLAIPQEWKEWRYFDLVVIFAPVVVIMFFSGFIYLLVIRSMLLLASAMLALSKLITG